jgi:Met-zincin/Domain of unknown function (DUF5117)
LASISGPAGPNSPLNSANSAQINAKKGKKPKKSKKPKGGSAANVAVDSASLGETKSAIAGALAIPAAANPVEGAEEIPGMFKVLRKDNKVWFSISPDDMNKPFFFSANISKGLGEKRMVGSEMGDSYLAEFRRAGDQVQLVALHTENFAAPGTPQETFVKEGFADSLLSSAPVVPGDQPNEEVLVQADALLFKDIAGYQARLQGAYKTPFGLDTSNTSFTQIDNSEKQTSFGVQAHYKAPPVPPGTLPSTSPAAGSVLTEFRYNFLKLPETPMTPRLADERVGHFVTTRKDYTGDEGDGVVRYVNRWRLEKKDPDAAMSEPVQPITYWVAKDVPEEYREAVRDGVLEWNKAFEAIGFKGAIEVKQQTAADTFDTLDARHASVRWYTAADVGSAVGPSHVDPRSGEILDADIRMADVFGRSAKKFLLDNPPDAHVHEHGHLHGDHECQYQAHAGIEQQFANGLLKARGNDEAAKKLADAYVKDVVMHEVGHTLGLRHNFKGSTIHSAEQLQDAEFTKEHGLGSSVMDYHPFNLAGPGEKQGEYVMSTLGAYDFLAVKYAYAELDPSSEKEVLDKLAVQTTNDPKLAYETDEAADDMDPTVSRFDLGDNPLEFAQKQVQLARELWERAQTQELPEGTSYTELTRAFGSGLSKVSGAARLMTRYVGGVTLRRDRAGTENAIYEPIPAEKQREALGHITESLFQPESFRFKPEFVSRLAQERFGNWGDQNIHVGQKVTSVQARALNALLDNDIAQRLIDNPEKLAEGTPVFRLSELYETLQKTIWSEIPAGKEISQSRRDLQREYIKAVQPILGADSKAPGEAKSLMRYVAQDLKKQLDKALEGEMSLENRAHLDDCSHSLGKVLNPDAK